MTSMMFHRYHWRHLDMKILWVLLAAAAALHSQVAHQHHPPRSAEEYIRILNDPGRDAWQKPQEVIGALSLTPDEVVADIGAGSGYFARRFVRHGAKVYAVDIDEKLLKAAGEGAPANLKTVLALPDDPKLPAAAIDTVFFCNSLHHIVKRAQYYAKLSRALKPGGRIVVIDFYKKPLPVGPPESMKLSEAEVAAEFEAAGFRKTGQFDFLPHQYFLVFAR
jgi:arsenite methyltransferase